MQLNGSHTAIAGTAKAIIQSLSRSVWAEVPAEEVSWGWLGKAAGESTGSMREREMGSFQERAEAPLPCPRVAGQVALETLTWKTASICVRKTGLDQRNNPLIELI